MRRLRRYLAFIGGKPCLGIYATSKYDAKDTLRMEIGALWRDDWVSYYGVKIKPLPMK